MRKRLHNISIILIVDDEVDILNLLQYNLEKAGFKVVSARDGPEAIELTKRERPTLIILDIMLPSMDGTEVCKTLKKEERTNPFFEKTFGPMDRRRLTKIIKGGKLPHEIMIHGKMDQVLEARFVPFSKDEKVVIGFFLDVTEEKRVEAIKRDFIANVSHELRTPLASIKGYAETLLDGTMDDRETLKEFLTVINRHANRMTILIEGLLTLSMLESHQIPMSFEPLDMKGIISGVIQGFEKQAKDKGLALVIDIGEDLPRVMGDRVRLEQVITNLIDNAIKYTNSGRIRVGAVADGNGLIVNVEDTGIGIPEKDIPRIFERFYRVDKARSRELGGTGLGLAIVKHIILSHKGKVWVDSKVGKGTRFSFVIPFNFKR